MNARHAALLTALALTIAACAGGSNPGQSGSATVAAMPDTATMTVQERVKAGRALWEEKCRTVAGEKIYRTVENVEGILLMKVRPRASGREWSDPNWPGAAFARESQTDEYIATFLGYEEGGSTLDGTPTPITPTYRGSINTNQNPGGVPGYRWVDVIDEKDGKRWRYSGRWYEPWQTDKDYLKGYIKFSLDRTPAPNLAPRYGVTFEDHVILEERALGVASSTIKVIDLTTKEVMGELARYAVSGTLSDANPSPWLTAYRCPDHARGTNAATRKFVDQVLRPKKLEK
ncbi:MAG: hypothetical protein IPH08_03465 [Rhodocyclaceae bacterium]|nr:hypothetical protein [Rhodocyclaceae bacterium]MBK6906220.1 hypothetical protein [Rhodocyclaceae bacterium]